MRRGDPRARRPRGRNRPGALLGRPKKFGFAIAALERLRGYGGRLRVDFYVTLGWLLLADGRRNDARVEPRHAESLQPKQAAVAELVRAISGRE